jgi:hypothetical protein
VEQLQRGGQVPHLDSAAPVAREYKPNRIQKLSHRFIFSCGQCLCRAALAGVSGFDIMVHQQVRNATTLSDVLV